MPGHSVRQLARFGYSVYPTLLSPDGRWLALTLGLSARSLRAASILVDTQDDAHRWWKTRDSFYSDAFLTPHSYTRSPWLPDGRLIWAEGGQVVIGDEKGEQILNPPEPVYQAEYASQDIAFAISDVGNLWRVDLGSGNWEKVTTPRPPRTGNLGNSFHLAWDGTYGLAFQGGQMWRIPAKMGMAAEPLPDVIVNPVGRGGGTIPTAELAGSPFWLIGYAITTQNGEAEGFLVDLRNGHVVTAQDLGISTEYALVDYSISPGGHWLAITLRRRGTPFTGPNDSNLDLYLAPAQDLMAGRVLKGVSVAAWHTSPSAIILKDGAADTLRVMRLPLSPDNQMTSLAEVKPPIATLPDVIVAVDANSPARLQEFSLDGHLLGILDLSAYYDEVHTLEGALDLRAHEGETRSAMVGPARVFVGVTGGQPHDGSGCTEALIEWDR